MRGLSDNRVENKKLFIKKIKKPSNSLIGTIMLLFLTVNISTLVTPVKAISEDELTPVTARSKDESIPLITKEYTIPLLDMVINATGYNTIPWPQLTTGSIIVSIRIVDLEVHENELYLIITANFESWTIWEGEKFSLGTFYRNMMVSMRLNNLNNPLLNLIIPIPDYSYSPSPIGVAFYQDQLVTTMRTKKDENWVIIFYEEVGDNIDGKFQQIYNTTNDYIQNSKYLAISNHTACILKEMEQKFYQFNLSSIHYVSDNVTTNFLYINGICYNENKLWCLGKDVMNSSLSLTYYDLENKKWTVFENKLPNSASSGLAVYNETLLTVASDDKGNETKIIQILLENLLTVTSSSKYSGFWVCFDSFSFLFAAIVLVLTVRKKATFKFVKKTVSSDKLFS